MAHAGGKCCLKSGPSNDKQLNVQGWQMFWKLPAGVTAEDGMFQEVRGACCGSCVKGGIVMLTGIV